MAAMNCLFSISSGWKIGRLAIMAPSIAIAHLKVKKNNTSIY